MSSRPEAQVAASLSAGPLPENRSLPPQVAGVWVRPKITYVLAADGRFERHWNSSMSSGGWGQPTLTMSSASTDTGRWRALSDSVILVELEQSEEPAFLMAGVKREGRNLRIGTALWLPGE